MTTLLHASGLDIAIGGRTLVTGLELTIAAGERWAVLGPNGAGKSTLLHTLAGLRDAAGDLSWRGRPLRDLPRAELARELGLLLQDDSDPFPATVLETVLTGRHPHLGRWGWESPADLALARAALAQVDLAALAARDLASLSGGERRRAAIATLLVQAPRLALLDEPTNHLDLRHQVGLMTHLADRFCQPEHALLAVLHDPNQALRHCNRLLLLYGDGRWEADPATELADADRLSALYGQPLAAVPRDGQTLFVPR